MINKEDNKQLLNWVINKIESEYSDDVSLLIGYEENTENRLYGYYKQPFDYYIPETKKGFKLADTFIIGETGYDLYPRSWERIENSAQLLGDNLAVLSESKVLYCRSEADKQRFVSYQEKQKQNLQDKKFVYKRALEKLNITMDLYRNILFSYNLSEIRMAAGYICFFLSEAVGFINQQILKYGSKNLKSELASMDKLPQNFISYLEMIVKVNSKEEVRNLCFLIINSTRDFLEENTIPLDRVPKTGYGSLAGWYEELSYTWRQLYESCKLENFESAYHTGCFLQNELYIVKEEFDLNDVELMDRFSYKDLSGFSERAKELEEYIIKTIKRLGEEINSYKNINDFLLKNR